MNKETRMKNKISQQKFKMDYDQLCDRKRSWVNGMYIAMIDDKEVKKK